MSNIWTPNNKYYRLYPWICWLLAAAFYFFQYGCLVFPSSIVTQLQQSFSASPSQVGVIYSAFIYAYIIMQIPAGLLFDRYDSHKILSIATLLLAAGCLTLAYASNLYVAIAGRIIMGIGGSFAFVGAIYLGKAWFSATVFPIIIGLTGALGSLGAVGLNSAFSTLTDIMSWRVIATTLGIVVAILSILIHLLIRNKPRTKTNLPPIAIKQLISSLLTNKNLIIIALFTGLGFAHFVTLIDMWNIPYLKHEFELSDTQAVSINSIAFIGIIVGYIVYGQLSRFFSCKNLILYTLIAQSILLFMEFNTPIQLTAEAIVLFSLGFCAAVFVLSFSLAKDYIAPSEYGITVGLLNMFFTLLGLLFAPLFGYIISQPAHSTQMATLPILLASIAAAILCLCLSKPKKGEPMLKEIFYK